MVILSMCLTHSRVNILVGFLRNSKLMSWRASRLFVSLFARLFAHWLGPLFVTVGACRLSAQECCWVALCVDCWIDNF